MPLIKVNNLAWEKGNGLLPAIIQDVNTGQVLMLGYMNVNALAKTLETKKVTFYSRSKDRLWTKGETSGNWLDFVSAEMDCDADTILIQARHTARHAIQVVKPVLIITRLAKTCF